MLIPIRDHNPSGRRPYVGWLLIAANVLIFAAYWPLFDEPRALERFFDAWALVPRQVAAGEGWHGLLTSMFLHGGFLHLAGNMLFLWIFGDNLEDALGHLGFLAFYLGSGVVAGLAQYLADPASPVPMVGASGAIAGLMGGYLLLFPRARIDMLFFLVIFVRVFSLPAWVMLGLWFAFQVLGGAVTSMDGGGVAYWAHAGGFLAGLVLMLPVFLRLGGPAFWARTHGVPPHPEAVAPSRYTRVPRVPRRRGPWSS
ncbi:MAG: rhomboid family intramembrane serine protease [Alphaproteobacteria bacterium HGW-Alphaproteobacteria-2]|nr:MAG: rhomboid family intramembrane serine protease [Alphaproteobacteria bacterium HGW-Alphaproteobacteria-2]